MGFQTSQEIEGRISFGYLQLLIVISFCMLVSHCTFLAMIYRNVLCFFAAKALNCTDIHCFPVFDTKRTYRLSSVFFIDSPLPSVISDMSLDLFDNIKKKIETNTRDSLFILE